MVDGNMPGMTWQGLGEPPAASYLCGFCGDRVASRQGWIARLDATQTWAYIRLCPSCRCPTFFDTLKDRTPGSLPGSEVEHVPEDLAALYSEARMSTGVGANTAAVMVCRKMLMNIAADKGADDKALDSFLGSVEYLAAEGYVPPGGMAWVEYVRKRGNEANHKIELMKAEDAEALVRFVEMLLRFIYEFPNLVPGQTEE